MTDEKKYSRVEIVNALNQLKVSHLEKYLFEKLDSATGSMKSSILSNEKYSKNSILESVVENKESIKNIYAEFIDKGEFKMVTEDQNDFSIFELTLLTPTTATFKIYQKAEKLVIQRPNYLNGCEKDIERDGNLLINKNLGTAYYSDDKWIINSKLNVKITKTK